MKKLSITECRKFLKDKKNMQFQNLYRMIKKYVEKYDNYESQYMIQTSNAYQKNLEAKKLKSYNYDIDEVVKTINRI